MLLLNRSCWLQELPGALTWTAKLEASDDHGTASRSDLPWEQGTADRCRPGRRPRPGPVHSGGSGRSSHLHRSRRCRPCSWRSGVAGLSPRGGHGRDAPGWRACAGWAAGSGGECPRSSHAGTPAGKAEDGLSSGHSGITAIMPRAHLALGFCLSHVLLNKRGTFSPEWNPTNLWEITTKPLWVSECVCVLSYYVVSDPFVTP